MIPVTTPELAPTVAIEVYAGSDHVPPLIEAVRVVDKPVQTTPLPEIDAPGLTVTDLVA